MKVILNILAGGGGLLLATIPLEKVGVVYLDSLHKVKLCNISYRVSTYSARGWCLT